VGWLGALAAVVYALRLATLFTTGGVHSGSGLLGLWLPATALSTWTLVASVVLTRGVAGSVSPRTGTGI
jgi:hypothetical protein